MNKARCVAALSMAVVVFVAFTATAQASHLSPAAQGHISVYNADANWDGARALIEVQEGSISLDDADAGRLISQHLMIADYSTYGTTRFVRAGIVRQQMGTGLAGITTAFYWLTRNSSGDHWHYVVNNDPAAFACQQPPVRICRESSGSTAFTVRIDGDYANDASGDHLASPGFTEMDYYRVGMITNASSGHYGSAGNPAENINIKRTTDYGQTWDYPAISTAQDPTASDAYCDWTTRVRSSWDYR
jgi:hypothetical protein